MPTLLRKLHWSITQRGLIGTLNAAAKAVTRKSSPIVQHPFDQRYGTDTSGLIGGGSLAVGHPHDAYITAYAGIAPSRFEAAIERWRTTLANAQIEDYTFIDLGCGKGRALLLASRLLFRQVIGIELNPQLAEIAVHNVERWKHLGDPRCGISVHVGDATQPDLPAGPAVLFFYNSFAALLVRKLAENLSRAATSHSVDLIYQNASCAHVFVANPHFEELWAGSLPLSDEDSEFDPVASIDDPSAIYRLQQAAPA